jgi:hypothetical protein
MLAILSPPSRVNEETLDVSDTGNELAWLPVASRLQHRGESDQPIIVERSA